MSSPDPTIRPTIPGRYLAELLAHTGLDAGRALAACGLPRDATTQPRFRASIAQLERLHAYACTACDDELLGAFAHKVPRGSYAVALRMFAGCRDLAEMLESAIRFYGLFDRGHRYWAVARDRGRAVLRVQLRTAAQARSICFVHAMLLSPWRTAAWLVGEAIPVRAIRLDPQFRAFAGETAYLFGCEATWLPRAAELQLDADWLARPVVRRVAEIDDHVRTSLRTMLAAPAGDTLEALVRGALARDPHADLSAIAHRLHASRATLARRLAARGLAFQQLKDHVRRDHAIDLLVGSQLPLAVIAERLGFSEPSAFARAFKAWTGVSPGRYRTRRATPP